MLEDFAGGYYRAEMTVQPYKQGPTIEQGLYDFINREFYYKTDAPITMRVGLSNSFHFRPSAEGAIPTDVLGLPEQLCDEMNVHPSAEGVNVFILKPAHAYLFGQAEKLGGSFEDSSNISDTTLEEEDKRFFNLGSSNTGQGSQNNDSGNGVR
jgi:hypothetical protein